MAQKHANPPGGVPVCENVILARGMEDIATGANKDGDEELAINLQTGQLTVFSRRGVIIAVIIAVSIQLVVSVFCAVSQIVSARTPSVVGKMHVMTQVAREGFPLSNSFIVPLPSLLPLL